jgi:hypothetical protein
MASAAYPVHAHSTACGHTRIVHVAAEEEIAKMVDEMMAGRTKPIQMLRVGATLYKRMTSFDGTAIGKMAAGACCVHGGRCVPCVHDLCEEQSWPACDPPLRTCTACHQSDCRRIYTQC